MTRPPLLMVSEPGSFAERTIVHRKPQIIANVIANNAYPPEIVNALSGLAHEIARECVQPLQEGTADPADKVFWHHAWRRWEGRTWRQLGWFFAETYFYRRLLETVGYFAPGPWRRHDPFGAEKAAALASGLDIMAGYAPWPDNWNAETRVVAWLYRSLWGNRADLSNMTIQRDLETAVHASSEHLLVDDTASVAARLASGRVERLDWIADNSGLELLVDLDTIDMLLAEGLVREVHLHVKPQPYFVSDAMVVDVENTLAALAGHPAAALRAIGERLRTAKAKGRLHLDTHPFWATCLGYVDLAPDLAVALAQADLIVLKGDVNYRRLLDDRQWPPTTPLEAVTAYMPAPFCALRTCKGELIVGLREGQAEDLTAQDTDWMINGLRGVVHYVVPEKATPPRR